MTEPERAKNLLGTLLLQALLVICWALVLAKTYFLIRGHEAPAFIDYSYMVALPVALWYFKVGLELLGIWFYLGVLSFIEVGALFWIVRAWRRYLLNDEAKAMSLGWTIVATVLAVNFVILVFFVARDIFLARQTKSSTKTAAGQVHPTA
ncbi:MAG: hypothetical protein WAO58_05790 [Fimbriimonadaceae bacterium]